MAINILPRMNKVSLALITSDNKNLHKKCIISHYNQTEITLESIDVCKRLHIRLKNSSIQRINNNTLQILMDGTNTKYTIEFENTDFMESILTVILSCIDENYFDSAYVLKLYTNDIDRSQILKMQNEIINGGVITDKINMKDFKYLDVLLKHGDYVIIGEILRNIRKILEIHNLEDNTVDHLDFKQIIDHKRFMVFYNEVLNKDLSRERKDFILSIIELVIEKDYERYTYSDIINNITTFQEIMKYLNYCRKIRKQITKDLISYFLLNKNNDEFASVLLFVSEYWVEEVRGFIYNNLDLFFSVFREVLHKNETFYEEIENLYFATCFIFNTDCQSELLVQFYKKIHVLFFINMDVIYNSKRSINHFIVHHYRNLDLLLFMEKKHDFMFPEFFISTGLYNYFKQVRHENDEILFFWNQMKISIENNESVLKEYFT